MVIRRNTLAFLVSVSILRKNPSEAIIFTNKGLGCSLLLMDLGMPPRSSYLSTFSEFREEYGT